jgi:hypothetical protein
VSYRPGHNLDTDHARRVPTTRALVGALVAEGDGVYLVTDDDAIGLQSHRPALLHTLAERYSFLDWEVTSGLLLPANREGLASFPAASVAVDALSPCFG